MPGPEARAVPCPLCNEKFFPAWAPGEQGGKIDGSFGAGELLIGNSLRNHEEDHVEHHEPSRSIKDARISGTCGDFINMMILFH
jgi:hypothetical protein